MRQKSEHPESPSERLVKNIRRATRKRHSSEEKIRIVLDDLRGERRRQSWPGPPRPRRETLCADLVGAAGGPMSGRRRDRTRHWFHNCDAEGLSLHLRN